MNKTVLYIIIAVVVAGGVGFFGGAQYGKAQVKTPGSQFAGAGQFGGARGGAGGARTGARTGGGFVTGQILGATPTGITVKIGTGGSKIIFTSASTTITKSAAGSMTDLTIGQNVVVTGTPNSDGSVTAQSIQIRSDMPPMMPQ